MMRVIGPTAAVRAMVATRSVDFRKGADGLAEDQLLLGFEKAEQVEADGLA